MDYLARDRRRSVAAIAGTFLLIACGSRSSIPEGLGHAGGAGGQAASFGTGGSLPDGVGGGVGASCSELPENDFNSGPGLWANGIRIVPSSGDGYTVSIPSVVAWTHGVSLAYTMTREESVDEANEVSPGLWLAHKGTPLGAADPAPADQAFSVKLIDPAGIAGGSIASDGESLFISYRSEQGLGLATFTAGTWSSELVEVSSAPRGVSFSSACRVARDGTVHIVYDASGSVRHAVRGQDGWTVESLAAFAIPDPVDDLDLELDREGAPHVIWVESSDDERVLKYGVMQSAWAIETVPVPASPDDAALEITPEGFPDIVVLNRNLPGGPPYYGRKRTGVWDFEAMSPEFSGFGYISFGLGVDGVAHVIVSAFVPYYLTNRRGSWEFETLSMVTDDGTSIFVEDSGALHVVARSFNFPQNTAPVYSTNRAAMLDGLDQNCDGVDGVDADGDGIASMWTGGSDCEDLDPSVSSCPLIR